MRVHALPADDVRLVRLFGLSLPVLAQARDHRVDAGGEDLVLFPGLRVWILLPLGRVLKGCLHWLNSRHRLLAFLLHGRAHAVASLSLLGLGGPLCCGIWVAALGLVVVAELDGLVRLPALGDGDRNCSCGPADSLLLVAGILCALHNLLVPT